MRNLLHMGNLDALSTSDLAVRRRTYVAVPLGATEQHGPHLPLGTDTTIAVALAEHLARVRTDVVVAPAVAITASGEHNDFPGTLSIGTEVLVSVLVELCRSADWADGVIIVNGHGGNIEALAAAASRLKYEQRNVLIWWPSAPNDDRADAHAGWLETSVMLHLAPHTVRAELAAPGSAAPIDEIIGQLRSAGVCSVSPSGVLGNPVGATADAGAEILAMWQDDLTARVDAWAQ